MINRGQPVDHAADLEGGREEQAVLAGLRTFLESLAAESRRIVQRGGRVKIVLTYGL